MLICHQIEMEKLKSDLETGKITEEKLKEQVQEITQEIEFVTRIITLGSRRSRAFRIAQYVNFGISVVTGASALFLLKEAFFKWFDLQECLFYLCELAVIAVLFVIPWRLCAYFLHRENLPLEMQFQWCDKVLPREKNRWRVILHLYANIPAGIFSRMIRFTILDNEMIVNRLNRRYQEMNNLLQNKEKKETEA